MAGEATASGAPETALVGVLAGLIEWAEHAGVDFQAGLVKARRAVLERAGRV